MGAIHLLRSQNSLDSEQDIPRGVQKHPCRFHHRLDRRIPVETLRLAQLPLRLRLLAAQGLLRRREGHTHAAVSGGQETRHETQPHQRGGDKQIKEAFWESYC